MNKKPFEPLTLVSDGYETVKNHVENNAELLNISKKTISFLTGFYSDFALELFSSIDYIVIKNNTIDKDIIIKKLESWSDRKRSLFSNPKYIDISLNHIQKTTFRAYRLESCSSFFARLAH